MALSDSLELSIKWIFCSIWLDSVSFHLISQNSEGTGGYAVRPRHQIPLSICGWNVNFICGFLVFFSQNPSLSILFFFSIERKLPRDYEILDSSFRIMAKRKHWKPFLMNGEIDWFMNSAESMCSLPSGSASWQLNEVWWTILSELYHLSSFQ